MCKEIPGWIKHLEEAQRGALMALEDYKSLAAGIEMCIDNIEVVIKEMEGIMNEQLSRG